MKNRNTDFEKSRDFNVNSQSIHWFPGHMMKTLRLIRREIKNVDMVITLLDARVPLSSLNREVDEMTGEKPKLYILNKRDLADKNITRQWIKYFEEKGAKAVPLNSKTNRNIKPVLTRAQELTQDVIERRQARGIVNKTINAMAVGIPNVGKSTFINRLAGSAKAKARDRPGVTRGKQVINIPGMSLMDMPGVLPRKFPDQKIAANLAFIGSIKDDILDIETLACLLIEELMGIYPEKLAERYKLSVDDIDGKSGYDILCMIARKRGMLLPGGIENTERASVTLLDEFRGNKLGEITLERP